MFNVAGKDTFFHHWIFKKKKYGEFVKYVIPGISLCKEF